MRIVSYADQSFLTSDDVASALLQLAAALARAGTSEVVAIPFVDGGGEARQAELTVGPASQLVSFESDAPEIALDEEETLASLRRRERLSSGTSGVPERSGDFAAPTMLDDLTDGF